MISVIVPVKYINNYVREAVSHYCLLNYSDFEVIIVPDSVRNNDFDSNDFRVLSARTTEKGLFEYTIQSQIRIRIIESGNISPGKKRNLACRYAEGDIFAFTDDDAYPSEDWLCNADRILKDETVGAVGGPAVTVMNDDIRKIGSGKVYESFMCSGKYVYRYIPVRQKDDSDIPSVNLIVKKETFETAGGFDPVFYPGEDTKLCMDIIGTGKRIVYDPSVLVYHHRRPLFSAHLKQTANYALHRGFFVKKYPGTSRKPAYFVPTLFVVFLAAGPAVCHAVPVLWYVYSGILLLYTVLSFISLRNCMCIPEKLSYRFRLIFLSFAGLFATHIGYGIFFVRGLLTGELKR